MLLVALLFMAARWTIGAEMEEVGEPASYSWTSPDGSIPFLPKLNATKTLHDHGDPTDHEQYMLELVNWARANPGLEAARLGIDLNEDLPPGTISTDPKPPLSFHPFLLSAARGHNAWMLNANIFSHTGANNSSPGDRMSAAGYSFVHPGGWGENIAWRGTTASSFDLKYFVELLHDGLFRSEGHRKNLMNPKYDEVGVGVNTGYFYRDGENWNSTMASQNFAYSSSTPGPLVVGLVFRDTNGNGTYDPGEGIPGVTVTPEVGDYYAVTSSSGGYAFPFSGTGGLEVEFSGGELVQTIMRSAIRGAENVKLDVELNSATPLLISPASITMSPALYQFTFSGPADLQVEVQRSTDFINWTALATYILGAEPVVFQDSDPPADQASYRIFVP